MRVRQHDSECPAFRPVVALDTSTQFPAFTVAAAENLIASLTAARDAAYSSGYDLGYLDGYEAGLRELLGDAATALGVAA